MARRFPLIHAVLAICTAGLVAQADAAAPQPATPARPDGPAAIALGESVVALNGPWKFQTGDSPIDSATGKLLWADPGFDDLSWKSMDLTPGPSDVGPGTGSYVNIPGWTARGYKGYFGYAWYRLTVRIEDTRPAQGERQGLTPALAIKMPALVDDAYQVYVDGRYLGEFGRFTQHGVVTISTAAEAFLLPADLPPGAPLTISVRMWMDDKVGINQRQFGGMHGPPLLGRASAIEDMVQLDEATFLRLHASTFVAVLFSLLVGVGALWCSLVDRTEPAFRWLALVCVLVAVPSYAQTFLPGPIRTHLPYLQVSLAILISLRLASWIIFWAHWFRLKGIGLLHRLTWTCVAILILTTIPITRPFLGGLVPISAAEWLQPLTVFLRSLLGLLLLWVTWQGVRRDRAEGWLALPIVLLVAVALFQPELVMARVPYLSAYVFLAGYRVTIQVLANTASLAIISVLEIRRLLASQQSRFALQLEREQARSVQQVLIPDRIPDLPGLSIRSAYRPFGEVGGDFFQILPGKNGGVLAVVGDVSGKGMPAAMTVSLLVGTLRTLAHYTESPGEILAAMNQRMQGRNQGGFTTCLVLRADSGGGLAIANAGHIGPYLAGKELALENGLPLGLAAEQTYAERIFQMAPGEQLTLMTDGVVEARDKAGMLLGFERCAALSTQPADEIASAAQAFGQEDDITVLTLSYAGAPALVQGHRIDPDRLKS